VLASCGSDGSTAEVVIRGADDVQVMTPAEVAAERPDLVATTTAPTEEPPAAAADADGTAAVADESSSPSDAVATTDAAEDAADTVPQNVDDRPAEIKLFDAFGRFRSCLDDRGYGIDGNLLDPNNPAYQDPDYADAVSTCAARTDIVAVLQEVQATRANLTPEQVEERNEVFTELRDCLVEQGWTVETTTSEIGLLEPTVFQNAEGVLDERDINRCLSEQNLGE